MRRILPLHILQSKGYDFRGYETGNFRKLVNWALGVEEIENDYLPRTLNAAFVWDTVELTDENHVSWSRFSNRLKARDDNISELARSNLKSQVLFYFTEEAGPSIDQLAEEEDLEGFE